MLGVLGGDGVQGTTGAVGYDNAGPQCLQQHGMRFLSSCDMTSYLYAKAKMGAVTTLLIEDFPG